jgi:hypothetical protein
MQKREHYCFAQGDTDLGRAQHSLTSNQPTFLHNWLLILHNSLRLTRSSPAKYTHKPTPMHPRHIAPRNRDGTGRVMR